MSLFNGIKWPYATMQQLNLDWILEKLQTIVPSDGAVGQILRRTSDGSAWSDESVESVNGKKGAVNLQAGDVGALADTVPHITQIGEGEGGWTWELYNDNTVDLYMTKEVTISEFASTSYGGLYQFGPIALPFALDSGYTITAGCKIGEGISIISECNPISTTYFDINGQSSLSGQQTCIVYAHLHGKKATSRAVASTVEDISRFYKRKNKS